MLETFFFFRKNNTHTEIPLLGVSVDRFARFNKNKNKTETPSYILFSDKQ